MSLSQPSWFWDRSGRGCPPASGCSEELQVLRLQLGAEGEPGLAKRQLHTPKKSCPQVLPCSLGQAAGTACGWVTRDSPRSIPAGRERDRLRPPDTPRRYLHTWGGLGGSAPPRPAASPPPTPPGSRWGSPSTEGEAKRAAREPSASVPTPKYARGRRYRYRDFFITRSAKK